MGHEEWDSRGIEFVTGPGECRGRLFVDGAVLRSVMLSVGLVLGSCVVHARPSTSAPRPAPAPVATVSTISDVPDAGAAGGGTVVDAPALPTDAGATPLAFRPFTPPAPRVLAPPARARRGCATIEEKIEAEASELAALDRFLRQRGEMLLIASEPRDGEWDTQAVQRGDVLRGSQGERLLVLGRTSCPVPQILSLTADGEVYVVRPDPAARATRRRRTCQPNCEPCSGGAQHPPTLLTVEVPEGARLGPARVVRFPIDRRDVFRADPCMRP